MNGAFRYPGLRSFTQDQESLFFGREREKQELFHLIAVEKSVVLFSKSGIGKTSLLNAGVIPLLEAAGMAPVPIRFGNELIKPEEHFRRQFDRAYRHFNGLPAATSDPGAAPGTFWEQIKASPFQHDQDQHVPVIIFDQFEELFTLYPNPEQRRRFVEELAALIMEKMPDGLRQSLRARLNDGSIKSAEVAALEKPPLIKLVFSIRSDLFHYMDELSETIPSILRSRYQLFGFSGEQAEEAIVRPAGIRSAGFISPAFGYVPEALREILETLTKNNEVEPFSLQAVCQALEERLVWQAQEKPASIQAMPRNAGGLPLIDTAFYGGKKGLQQILNEFYQNRLAELKEAWQKPAQLLIEDALVNENNRRRSMDVTDLLAREGITQELLDALEQRRLVRREPRLDSFYYEISHDALLPAVLNFRQERRLRAVQQEAAGERLKARISSVISAVAVLSMAVAVWFFFKAKNEAQNAKMEAFNARWLGANFIKGQGYYDAALGGLRDARPYAVYDYQREELDSTTTLWTKVWTWTAEADTFLAHGELRAAAQRYRAAFNASPDKRLQEKMETLEQQIRIDVNKYLSAAKRQHDFGKPDIACGYLDNAYELDPNNPAIASLMTRYGCSKK